MIVEVICQSVEDCIAAQKGGADRIELVSAVYLGGLTPTVGTVKRVKEVVSIPIMAMLRPRGAGYCYSESEFQTMLLDAKLLLEAGADGIVFGFLNEDGTLHKEYNQQLADLCQQYGKEAVFHRAFDVAANINNAEQLIGWGVNRILTSGFASNALSGADVLRQLQEQYGDRIHILAGASVSSGNVAEIVRLSGVTQVHTSGRDWKVDSTTLSNPNAPVTYDIDHADSYEYFSGNKLAEFLTALDNQ